MLLIDYQTQLSATVDRRPASSGEFGRVFKLVRFSNSSGLRTSSDELEIPPRPLTARVRTKLKFVHRRPDEFGCQRSENSGRNCKIYPIRPTPTVDRTSSDEFA